MDGRTDGPQRPLCRHCSERSAHELLPCCRYWLSTPSICEQVCCAHHPLAEWSVDVKRMSSKPEKSSLEISGKKLRSESQMLQCFLVHLLKSGLIPQHPLPAASSEKPALPKLPSRLPSAIHTLVTSSRGAQQRPDRPNGLPASRGSRGCSKEPCSWCIVSSPAADH